MQKKIFKNISWLLTAQIITKAISFFYTLFLARSLGVGDFGLYISALSYFALVSVVADFGISNYLIRELSIDKSKYPKLLATTILLRLTMLSVTFSLFAMAFYLFDPDRLRGVLATMAILAVLPQAVGLTLDSSFVALQNLKSSALSLIVLSLATSVVGVLMIKSNVGVMGPVLALIIGQVIYVMFQFVICLRLKIDFIGPVSLNSVKSLIKDALPYGLISILGLLYFKVDGLILVYLKGPYDAGIYGVAYKFLEAVALIPSTISVAIFPVMAKLAAYDKDNLYKLYLKLTKVLLVLSIFIALGFYLLLPVIITKLLLQYKQAVDVIRILSFTIPFLFMISIQGVVLFSEKKFLYPLFKMSIFNLALTLFLNFLFIPKYSYFASAWITLASDVIGFFLFYIFIRHHYAKSA